MTSKIVSSALIYAVIVAAVYLVTGDFSPRHSIFALAASVVTVLGASLSNSRREYFPPLVMLLLSAATVIYGRLFTNSIFRSWDAYIFIAYAASLAALILFIVSLITRSWLKRLVSLSFSALWFVVIMTLCGYIIAEGAWPNVDWIIAMLQTNFTEAKDYMTESFGVGAAFMLALPTALACLFSRMTGNLRLRGHSRKFIILSLVFFLLATGTVYRCRENIMTAPFFKARNCISNFDKFKELHDSLHPVKPHVKSQAFPGLYVLVIGESETRDHMSAYGYSRKTTPYLDEKMKEPGTIVFKNAYSSYPTTVQSLAYALTAKNQYNENELASSPTLIETACAAGLHTAYLSNQTRYSVYNMPIAVIQEGAQEHIWLNEYSYDEYYDEELVNRITKVNTDGNTFLILHLIGSHNPYRERYPKDFDIFSGGRGKVDEYDSSVLYTDHVLKQLYDRVSALPGFSAMVYFSDHGEGIDSGRLHNSVNWEWPMVRIPMFAIFSEKYMNEHPDIYKNLKSHTDAPFTNDLIFDMMVGIMGIETMDSEAENMITSSNYNADWERFATIYGERRIIDDDTGK